MVRSHFMSARWQGWKKIDPSDRCKECDKATCAFVGPGKQNNSSKSRSLCREGGGGLDYFYFLQLYCPNGISSFRKFGLVVPLPPPPGESQLRQSRATQLAVQAGCFSVSTIHRTLTWATGSLTCAQMLMHAMAHGDVRTHVRECALKVD